METMPYGYIQITDDLAVVFTWRGYYRWALDEERGVGRWNRNQIRPHVPLSFPAAVTTEVESFGYEKTRPVAHAPEAIYQALAAMWPAFRIRHCRVCGCTDYDCSGCIERTGEPCSWAEADLCSACVDAPAEGS